MVLAFADAMISYRCALHYAFFRKRCSLDYAWFLILNQTMHKHGCWVFWTFNCVQLSLKNITICIIYRGILQISIWSFSALPTRSSNSHQHYRWLLTLVVTKFGAWQFWFLCHSFLHCTYFVVCFEKCKIKNINILVFSFLSTPAGGGDSFSL